MHEQSQHAVSDRLKAGYDTNRQITSAIYCERSKKVARALGNKNAVLVKDNGAVCVAGNQYDAEAVELVMEKAAKTAVGAELYADVKPLSALDSNLMRIIYKLKYSKKAGK